MINNKPFLSKISVEEINLLPKKKFQGNIFVIEKFNQLDYFKERLAKYNVLGFDTETRPTFKKGRTNKVALIQLATSEDAFLIRLNKIGLPKTLVNIFEDSRIMKVGVAIKDDVNSLLNLKNFRPAGFIELQDYVKEFNIQDNGLKKLAANVLGFRISKRQQTSNWEKDLLDEDQIYYAATDAWVCYEIYKKLQNQYN